ncbi:MAG: tetratricopeptide repeat protein [Anaerolineae bacterium]|nr:tetratricopeptide repeat protein [Anaerolineae bacterium]
MDLQETISPYPYPGHNLPTSQAPEFKIGYGDYLRFRNLVQQYSGLYFPEKKRVDLESGLLRALDESPFMPINGYYDLNSYYHLLADPTDPAGQVEMNRLIKNLAVGETHFFRDQPQFDALANHILPALIARKRAEAAVVGPGLQPQLRIWSAGCATGEEPYSIAILLKELIPDLDDWRILILATDLNQEALTRAREAVYSDWSFRELRAKMFRPRYFSQESRPGMLPDGFHSPFSRLRYRLRRDIRQMVTFAPLNLAEDDYPAVHNYAYSMDLILCRNVTIYFTEKTTRQIIARFYNTLVEGGWLVVGHSEPCLVIYRDFHAVSFPGALFYQKTGRPAPWPETWEWLDRDEEAEELSPHLKNRSCPNLSTEQFPSAITPSIETDIILPPPDSGPPPPSDISLSPDPGPDSSASPSLSEPDSYQKAQALLNRGYIKEAIAELNRKLTITPDFAPAYTLLGRAYANMGRWAEARQWCQNAIVLDNLQAEAYFVLAQVHQHQNDLEPAINILKKAIYLERGEPLFHFTLASLYKKSGDLPRAQQSFKNSLRILEKWPPQQMVPDTGGATARHLLEIIRWNLDNLTVNITPGPTGLPDL